MASITKYRQKWLKYHKSYEKRAFRELRKVFKDWNNRITNLNIDERLIKQQLELITSSDDMLEAYQNIYFNIGRIHGRRVGKFINIELKEFTMNEFMDLFEQNLPIFLRDFGITRIQQVHQTYLDDVFKLFNDRLKAGKTLKETTDEVFKIMKSPRFYKWQAERIARTESTAAANYSATQAGEVSGFVMQKRWISALDARTRDPHASSNGKRVGLKEAFTVGGELLKYPGDPNGSAGNVINCRCTVAVIPARDSNGRLIRN